MQWRERAVHIASIINFAMMRHAGFTDPLVTHGQELNLRSKLFKRNIYAADIDNAAPLID